ncbi:MAG: HTH-type transcriptional regulator MmpR5 [Gemmatimonadaceae bacterium]|nr:HTH-type transcriptional regulator MmpR5 [Gemmatimonadaceae bacterium]
MDSAVRHFVESLGLHLASEGMPLIAGRVTAYLLISDGPRSLNEIASALCVSRASVSTDARRLEEKGLLVRSSLVGDRRTYYSFAPDGFRMALTGRIRQMTALRDMLEAAARIAPAARSPEIRARLAEWTDFHVAVIDSLQDLLTEWNQRSTNARRPSSRRRRAATA